MKSLGCRWRTCVLATEAYKENFNQPRVMVRARMLKKVLENMILSILEDTGYMARVAFVSDKLLRKIGLSGRSIVPMLIGFGCSVPSVMASRTLPSERDRKMTIMLTPFMSCTAKLPIYAFFAAAFFPKQAGLVMVGLYIFGIVMGIITALISKRFLFKGEAVPFVMELPNYRMPSAKTTFQLLWEKARISYKEPLVLSLSLLLSFGSYRVLI